MISGYVSAYTSYLAVGGCVFFVLSCFLLARFGFAFKMIYIPLPLTLLISLDLFSSLSGSSFCRAPSRHEVRADWCGGEEGRESGTLLLAARQLPGSFLRPGGWRRTVSLFPELALGLRVGV